MRFYDLLNNNAFWTIIGIILGSTINYIFWIFQSKKQENLQNRNERQKKIGEICDFFNVLDGKLKTIYGLCITGTAVDYFSEIQNFWTDVPIIKMRIYIQIFFGKCLKEYDDLQTSVSSFLEAMHKIMGKEYVSKNEFNQKYSEISIRRNDFINVLIKNYSKVISI